MPCSTNLKLSFALLLLFSAGSSYAQRPPSDEFSFRPDPSHWVVENCEADFQKDRVIRGARGNGWLRSVFPQRDFVLELEWKPEKLGFYDAGVFFRAPAPPQGEVWPDFFQINLKPGAIAKLKNVDVRQQAEAHAKADSWNHLKLTVKGDTAVAQLNGAEIWHTTSISNPTGFVALQVEEPNGGVMLYRNVKIAEQGFRNLLTTGLDGWEAAEGDPAACWKREGEELACTGAKGPWLRLSKTVKDFNLRLDYLLKPGGNSGVYIRVPEDGAHHGATSGIEVQILDDASGRYQDLKPYQYSGSLYAIVPADPRVTRQAGEWNALEIDCKEDRYLVRQNGVDVIVASGLTAPELLERRLEGYIGLQNHSEEVRFRNVRLGNSQQ